MDELFDFFWSCGIDESFLNTCGITSFLWNNSFLASYGLSKKKWSKDTSSPCFWPEKRFACPRLLIYTVFSPKRKFYRFFSKKFFEVSGWEKLFSSLMGIPSDIFRHCKLDYFFHNFVSAIAGTIRNLKHAFFSWILLGIWVLTEKFGYCVRQWI